MVSPETIELRNAVQAVLDKGESLPTALHIIAKQRETNRDALYQQLRRAGYKLKARRELVLIDSTHSEAV
jgi:hypothetical protein